MVNLSTVFISMMKYLVKKNETYNLQILVFLATKSTMTIDMKCIQVNTRSNKKKNRMTVLSCIVFFKQSIIKL